MHSNVFSRFFKIILFHYFMCGGVLLACMFGSPGAGVERQLWATMWVLGIQPRYSRSTASALNHLSCHKWFLLVGLKFEDQNGLLHVGQGLTYIGSPL